MYTRVNFKHIWENGRYLTNIDSLLDKLDKQTGNNHIKNPYVTPHISECDCMYECTEELEESYFSDGRCLFNICDLEWYYIPHQCDLMALISWSYLKYAKPYDIIDILYYPDHFVCVDQKNKIIYDMQHDISYFKGKKYISVDGIQSEIMQGKSRIISHDEVQIIINNDEFDLYPLVNPF